jgi:HTH-type transcriptional regulator / antitoxin HipB
MARITKKERTGPPEYGAIRSVADLGQLLRAERYRQDLKLDDLYATTGLTTRFLSEFERGLSNPTLSRVMDALQALGLEMIVVPRGRGQRILAQLNIDADTEAQRSEAQS